MFSQMVIRKDAALISTYYHKDFLLITNGQEINYSTFYQDHVSYYATEITYQVRYDEETLLEQGDRVAGRIWITVKKPAETEKEIEVLLIAKYKEDKLYRLWELTYPDWSQLMEFKDNQ